MAGQFVMIETDVIGVAILAKKRRGHFIVAINEVDQEGEGNATATDPKAS